MSKKIVNNSRDDSRGDTRSILRVSIEFDQIQVSIFSGFHPREVKKIFSEMLEEQPQLTKDKRFWRFARGISLSRFNKRFYYTVRLKPELLTDLACILDQFPAKRTVHLPTLSTLRPPKPKPKPIKILGFNLNIGFVVHKPKPKPKLIHCLTPAAALSKVEIKADIPLPGFCYAEAEAFQNQLARVMYPVKNNFARVLTRSDEKHKKVSQHLTGKTSYYFSTLKAYSENEQKINWPQRGRNSGASREDILYLRSDDNGLTWKLRIEARLKGRSLNILGGKTVPTSIDEINTKLAGVIFADLWRFQKFNVEAFTVAAQAEMTKNDNLPMSPRVLLQTLAAPDSQYFIRQRRLARQIAGRLGSKKLINQLNNQVFTKQITLSDLLAASFSEDR